MKTATPTRVTERLRHFQGERIQANDLQDEFDQFTQLRGLHVLALHQTWGIALGMETRLISNELVGVGPGLAYDAFGRELVIPKNAAIPGPQLVSPDMRADGVYELAIAYDADLGARERERETAPCDDDRPGRERPLYFWRRSGETKLGREVPLLAVQLADGKLRAQDLTVRRYTQPLARPHIGGGITAREQDWSNYLILSDIPLGVKITVDTSAAGFVGTPFYFASLQFNADTWQVGQQKIMARYGGVLFQEVANMTPTSFEYRVLFGFGRQRPDVNMMDLVNSFKQTIPQVTWCGIEPVEGCQPPAYFSILLPWLRRFNPVFDFSIGGIVR